MILFIFYSFSSLSHCHFVKYLQMHGSIEAEGMGMTKSITKFEFESTKEVIPSYFLIMLIPIL